jgi:YHS domain-containing protein
MTLDTETAAARTTRLGTQSYFCSNACRDTFEAHPEQFVAERHVTADHGIAHGASAAEAKGQDDPPFTQADGIAAPMFGSAGSGGLEYERISKPSNGSVAG